MERVLRRLRNAMTPATLLLLGVLLAVLLGIRVMESRRAVARAAAGTPAARAPAAAVAAAPAPAARRAAPGAVSPGWGEDPFARRFSAAGEEGPAHAARRAGPVGSPARATGLYLQGVMTGPMGRTALINGIVVREGERIGTREVLQIGQRSVVLLENGSVVTLSLQGEKR